jgi:8-oxo-dGTP pyrophosphatase MutT (NUDIX family)
MSLVGERLSIQMQNEYENRFYCRLRNALFKRQRTAIEAQDLKSAAVLVPLVFRENEPYLILTRRAMTVSQHRGQISFPGGASEPTDKSVEMTALRETREEIGLTPEQISIVGKMDDFTTISGFLVTPVVGIVADNAGFRPDEDEVAELFEEPLAAFQDPTIHDLITVDHDGTLHEYHSYEIGQNVVWGATAGIIHRLLTLLETRGAF